VRVGLIREGTYKPPDDDPQIVGRWREDFTPPGLFSLV